MTPARPAPPPPGGGSPAISAEPVSTAPAPAPSSAPAERKVCNAPVSPQLQQALAGRGAKARSCYEQLLRVDPQRAGVVLVNVRMSGQGQFDEATLIKDEIGDLDFAQCLLTNFREPTGTFIDGECVEVNIPLRFVPKKPDADAPAP